MRCFDHLTIWTSNASPLGARPVPGTGLEQKRPWRAEAPYLEGPALVLALLIALLAAPAHAAETQLVLSSTKIEHAAIPAITDGSHFGYDVANLGDVNGDGTDDIAVGARADGYSGSNSGAVYIVYLGASGNVVSYRKWSEASDPHNAFQLEASTFFGDGLAGLGDYDGDGHVEVAVGASLADPGAVPADSGAVWVIDLDPVTLAPLSSFLVASGSPIAGGTANLATLDAADRFGLRIANLGDWDGDGAPEIAVGSIGDDDGGTDNGAFYILYLKPDGSGVKTYTKISATAGGFDATLDADQSFLGNSLTAIGDLDGDGQTDLAVGASAEGPEGAVFLLRMDPACGTAGAMPAVPFTDCVVKPGVQRIAEGSGGFPEAISDGGGFGETLAWLDGPGSAILPRLAVGAKNVNSGRGEIWILSLGPTGLVTGADKITAGVNWSGALDANDNFPSGLAPLGDVDGNGVIDLAAGAWQDDNYYTDAGAVYLLRLSPCTTIVTHPIVFASPLDNGENPCLPISLPAGAQHTLHLFLETGSQVSTIPGNVCQDGLGDGNELCAWDVRVTTAGPLAITGFSPTPASGGGSTGPPAGMHTELVSATEFRANWIGPATPTDPTTGPVKIGDLYLSSTNAGGSVKLAAGSAAVGSALELLPMAGRTLALPEPGVNLGLASGLALLALLVLLARRRAAREGRLLALAAALTLPLLSSADPAAADISVKSQKNLTQPTGSVRGFGASLAPLGDLDGDGTQDLAVGDLQYFTQGRFWALLLDRVGGIAGYSQNDGPTGTPGEGYGRSLAYLGDIDGDGRPEIVHGRNPGTSTSIHRVDLVTLKPGGSRASETLLVDDTSTFASADGFGWSVAALGDIDGNGTIEFAAGEPGANGNGNGQAWVYSVDPTTRTVVGSSVFNNSNGGLPLSSLDNFGSAVVGVGDLDGNGVGDLAVGAAEDDDRNGACGHGSTDRPGSVYILFLQVTGTNTFGVASYQKISETQGGLNLCLPGPPNGTLANESGIGYSLAWRAQPEGGGVLYVGARYPGLMGENASVWVLFLNTDGTVRQRYRLSHNAGVGFTSPRLGQTSGFGSAVAALADINGDEVPDLAVGDMDGKVVSILYIQDSDHDGLDDNLDNCDFVHNPQQEDGDGDGVGDLCDNCVDVANANQDDLDGDGEGDACEPVEVVLQTTGTPAAPSWDLSLQCGTYSVTSLNGAIVLPSGATNPKTLSLSGASVGSSLVSGPGLVSPAGVRSDAIYFQATGNGAPDSRLCTALDPPVLLGTLTTGAISGTQLAAASLTAEGVGTPGFGLNLAETAGPVPVPQTDIRLVNGIPLPILDLELGPAVQTASGTRWEVRIARASDEFHRVAFGLIAPTGTATSDMHWRGCDTTPSSGVRTCCESPPCGDFDGLGVGTNVNPNRSWTVGPQATPPGTQLPHTMYVVLEGSALSSGSVDTVNPVSEGQYHILGEVELSGSPDLEPALTLDGVNDIDDEFSMGTVVPLEDVTEAPRNVEQVKLIGAFNPADDLDGDGIQDLGDNCPFAPNADQSNRGSFGNAADDSDVFGDACQCGESTGDGAVLDPDDFDEIRDYLSGRITNPVIAKQIEERCSVVGTTECNIRDLVFLKRALDAGAPSVETRCDAALSPASGP